MLPILRPPLPVQQQTNNVTKTGPNENSNSNFSTPYLPTGPNQNIAAPPSYPNQQLINQFNNTMSLSGPQAPLPQQSLAQQPLPQQFKSSNFGQQPTPQIQPQYQQNNQEKIPNQSISPSSGLFTTLEAVIYAIR